MNDQQDYLALIPTITLIPTEDIKSCPMPIRVYLQESENLYHWAQQDAALLLGAGLSSSCLDELPARIGALREAEARWQLEFRSRQEAEDQWMTTSEDIYALRDELLRAFRYALRKDVQALQQVARIAEGSGHADMIQDLTNLAALGRHHSDALTAIHFDLGKLDMAARMADSTAQLLARANGDRQQDNDARIIRDQAYTYLKQAVDEVRDCGKYVFFGNNARARGYAVDYYRQRNTPANPEATAASVEA